MLLLRQIGRQRRALRHIICAQRDDGDIESLIKAVQPTEGIFGSGACLGKQPERHILARSKARHHLPQKRLFLRIHPNTGGRGIANDQQP